MFIVTSQLNDTSGKLRQERHVREGWDPFHRKQQGTAVCAPHVNRVSYFKGDGASCMDDPSQSKRQMNPAVWKEIVAKYQQPSTPRALWQLLNTLGPLALLWYLMYLCLPISWWLLLPLAV